MRVVPDSNILISAFLWGGLPSRLIELGILGELELYVSEAIVHETLRVLRRRALDESTMDEASVYSQRSTSMIVPTQFLSVVPEDPDDNKILECAIAAKAHFIVTGDKHLLRLHPYGDIGVVRIRQFLESLGPIE